MKTKLTPEKLREIYSNPELRNQVAHAHGAYRRSDDEKPYELITCSYPTVYIVTQDQIEEAKKELARAKAEMIQNTRGKLVFIGMGMAQKEDLELIGNHRVRAYFKNRLGQNCFVEFIKGHDRWSGNNATARMLYPDHAMIESVSVPSERKCFGLYTESNALKFVNQVFGCDFKELVLDNYTLEPNEITSDARQVIEEAKA